MPETSPQTTQTPAPIRKPTANPVLVVLIDLFVCTVAAALVAGSLFYFSNYNQFAPGGVTGIASIVASLIAGDKDITQYMSILMVALNVPIFVLVAIFVNKKTGIMLCVYLVLQSVFLILLKHLHAEGVLSHYAALPSDTLYQEGNNVVYAALGVGVIAGFGYSLMLRRFGASGGTYAITALIKKVFPATNLAWFTFVLDASVVVLTLFVYHSGINPVFSTLCNIFISNLVVDFMLQGLRSGYKFEIITTYPDEITQELMTKLGRGVTTLHAQGGYTHSEKTLIVCIVRKRQVGECLKILRKYNATFSYSCKVNEVYGKFEEKPHYREKK